MQAPDIYNTAMAQILHFHLVTFPRIVRLYDRTLDVTCNSLGPCLCSVTSMTAPPFPLLLTFAEFLDAFTEVTLHSFPVSWMSRSYMGRNKNCGSWC
jgi:hypothetical protein